MSFDNDVNKSCSHMGDFSLRRQMETALHMCILVQEKFFLMWPITDTSISIENTELSSKHSNTSISIQDDELSSKHSNQSISIQNDELSSQTFQHKASAFEMMNFQANSPAEASAFKLIKFQTIIAKQSLALKMINSQSKISAQATFKQAFRQRMPYHTFVTHALGPLNVMPGESR